MESAFVLVFLGVIGLSQQAEWSYSNQGAWPGVCNVGRHQSPINIMTREAFVDFHGVHLRGPLVFRGYNNVDLEAFNNGHTLTWALTSGQPAPTMSGGPLKVEYTFAQFHIHWLSEHAIDGMKYPLEIHFVHIKSGLTMAEALKQPDGLAVFGVFGEVRSGNNSGIPLENIMQVVPNLVEPSNEAIPVGATDMTMLISPYPQSFYSYQGSLTTPLCNEAVTWIVMDKPISISDSQFIQFTKVDIGGTFNDRALQPLNNRMVYRSLASCSSVLAPSLLIFLASFFNCVSNSVVTKFNRGVCSLLNMKRKLMGHKIQDCAVLVN